MQRLGGAEGGGGAKEVLPSYQLVGLFAGFPSQSVSRLVDEKILPEGFAPTTATRISLTEVGPKETPTSLLNSISSLKVGMEQFGRDSSASATFDCVPSVSPLVDLNRRV